MNGFARIVLISATLSLLGCGPPPPNPFQWGKSSSKRSKAKECPAKVATAHQETQLLGFDEKYDSYIIKLRDSDPLRSATIRTASIRQLKNSGVKTEEITPGYLSLKLDNSKNRAAALSDLLANPNIEYIEPDYPITLYNFKANDTHIAKQWAHKNVQSAKAWQLSSGSRSIIVAVVDSGVDYSHPDLRDNMWRNPGETINGIDDDGNGFVDDIHGWNFAYNNNNPNADDTKSYHGTHVAGTVGAVGGNNRGIAGHAPTVQLMALKFMGSRGSGSTSMAIKSIDYAVKMGAQIINNSWGSRNSSLALQSAITRAERAGVLFIVAAGNSGMNVDKERWYPAGYTNSNILTVAATNSNDQLASWSNFGAQTIDIGAPGASILSTRNDETYAYLDGTSMAAPLVSGVAATMLAIRPSLSPKEVIDILTSTVDQNKSLLGRVRSGGRINAFKAVSAVIPSKAPGNPQKPVDGNTPPDIPEESTPTPPDC